MIKSLFHPSPRARLLLSSTLLIALPMATLLPGCGGGGDSSSSANIDRYSTFVRLSIYQTAQLTVSRGGNLVAGQLVINSAVATVAGKKGDGQREAADFSSNLPAGTYSLTGGFAPPRTFSLSGRFSAPLSTFSVFGQLPNSSSDSGSYTIKVGDQTVSGSFSTTSNTATPAPSASPSSTPGKTTG